MNITLVTSSYDKLVHGTDNDKKTGCGINLLRPENVTKYRRGAMMTDLKEITCEKCKASLAKKMIKSDKKEMARLLKEEKQREKMGMGDEGIVPLGNTTAKITRAPESGRAASGQDGRRPDNAPQNTAPVQQNASPAPQNAPMQAEPQPAVQEAPKTIPGTGVAMDAGLAQFAINVPEKEEPAPAPAEENDFLAQFAIQKPQEEEEHQPANANVQDDFLAQFAIPTPSAEPAEEVQQEGSGEPVYYTYNEETGEMDGLDFGAVQEAPQYVQPEPAVQVQSEDDIMQMFSIDDPEPQETPYGQPVYGQPVQPGIYDNDSSVIDVADHELSAVAQETEPVYGETEPNLSENTEWNYVANQLFGFDGTAPEDISVPQPEIPVPDQPGEMEELEIPVIQDIAAPVLDEVPTVEEIVAPVLDEIPTVEEIAAPVLDEVTTVEEIVAPVLDEVHTVEEIAAPVLDEIPTVEEIAAPVLDEVPTVEEIAAPVLDEVPTVEEIAAPVLDEIPTVEEIAAPVLDEVPTVEEITAPVLDEVPTVEEIAAPVLDEVPTVEEIAAPVVDEIPASTINSPEMAEKEYDPVMSDKNTTGNSAAAPAAKTAENPQIISVPQLAGYDANNKPVYKYVQMKLAGYDQKGQPVYTPVNAQQAAAKPAAAAPKAQTAAPAKPQAAAPAAKAQAAAPVQKTVANTVAAATAAAAQTTSAANQPVRYPVPKKPAKQKGVPTANISKIAVNPHSKATSQAFIDAIASSKDYADKNLIETQGLKANSPILTSVEDVLSTMGDDSAKQKKLAAAQQAVPVFEEYKAPTRTASRPSSAPRQTMQQQNTDARYMTKSELKAKKKQDKIDAKFKKEMNKRGL